MPRSVRIAIAFACWLGLAGLVFAGRALADVPRHGLRRAGFAALHVIWPLLAIWITRGLVRRDARTRTLALGIAIAGALLIGAQTLYLATVATFVEGRDVGSLTATFLGAVVGPFVALAWSLSRPSAKAWCARPPDA